MSKHGELDLGRSIRFMGEVLLTGEKVGANSGFWKILAEDAELFRKIVAVAYTKKIICKWSESSLAFNRIIASPEAQAVFNQEILSKSAPEDFKKIEITIVHISRFVGMPIESSIDQIKDELLKLGLKPAGPVESAAFVSLSKTAFLPERIITLMELDKMADKHDHWYKVPYLAVDYRGQIHFGLENIQIWPSDYTWFAAVRE
jgi:hypothetical protein